MTTESDPDYNNMHRQRARHELYSEGWELLKKYRVLPVRDKVRVLTLISRNLQSRDKKNRGNHQ